MVQEKYPEGHFVGQGIGIGIACGAGLGVPIGIALNNPAFFGLGLPIGLAVGVAIGTAKEKEAKEKGMIRPLTKKEKKRKDFGIYSGIALLVLGVIAFLILYLIR